MRYRQGLSSRRAADASRSGGLDASFFDLIIGESPRAKFGCCDGRPGFRPPVDL